MNAAEVLEEFKAAGALLEGHFKLSSGKHSGVYLQCARMLMEPARAERLCSAFCERLRQADVGPVDMVVSPAMGGVIVGYEVARQLGVAAMFTERVAGQLELRRGFEVPLGARVLMMEDVVTTGLSSQECISAIRQHGGEVVAAGALIDRSGGRAELDVPLISLAQIDAPIYDPDALPAELAAMPAEKPGSR